MFGILNGAVVLLHSLYIQVITHSRVHRKFINDQVIERYEQLLEQKEKEKQEALKSQQWNPEIEAKYDEKSCDERFVGKKPINLLSLLNYHVYN